MRARVCDTQHLPPARKKLSLYKEHLEKSIIESASQFYQRAASQWLEEFSVPTYLARAEAALEQEALRVDYLNHTTLEPLHLVCHTRLLRDPQETLLRHAGSGFQVMVEQEQYEGASRTAPRAPLRRGC
jgi:hypothetical protein